MWMYTNAIDPANSVIRSAMRFWTFAARSRSCIEQCGMRWGYVDRAGASPSFLLHPGYASKRMPGTAKRAEWR